MGLKGEYTSELTGSSRIPETGKDGILIVFLAVKKTFNQMVDRWMALP
jgi:hypothetical protein